MARQTANFGTVKNADGESDRRANLETTPDAPAAPQPAAPADPGAAKQDNKGNPTDAARADAYLLACQQLKALADFVKPRKDDDLVRDNGLHRVHIGMIREMADKADKGKKVSLSDGNCEMIGIVHAKLKKSGAIK